jgi:hypothetical protein
MDSTLLEGMQKKDKFLQSTLLITEIQEEEDMCVHVHVNLNYRSFNTLVQILTNLCY